MPAETRKTEEVRDDVRRATGERVEGEREPLCLERGERSSLFLEAHGKDEGEDGTDGEAGVVVRVFHDTGERVVVPSRVDAKGTRRVAHNRTLRSLVREAEATNLAEGVEEVNRTHGTGERRAREGDGAARVYAGAGLRRPSPVPLPPRLREVADLAKNASSVRRLAREAGVKESTIWSYLCQIAERDASFATHVLFESSLVCIDIARVCVEEGAESDALRGTLKTVMARLTEKTSLGSSPEWRCQENRYAQLRLARVCVARVARA